MKSLVVSVCITAVTDMAAVSLLVFFWVLLGSCEHQKNARRTPEEHQKNPEEPRRTQKEKNTSPPDYIHHPSFIVSPSPPERKYNY